MTSDDQFEHWFSTSQAMLILRGLGPEATVSIAEQAWHAGVTMVEVPFQRPEDYRSLALTCRAARSRGLVVGAGTVIDPTQVELVAQAGAAYIVSPGLDPQVVGTANRAGMAVLPGVATPSEILAAWRQGLRWVKVFPASVLGPGWIAAMRSPFPDVRMVATGGIDAENAPAFLDAGARVVAFGSAVVHDGVGSIARYAPL